ncbi:ABC transporter permease [Psychroflexus sp. CAK8W]|uniref:ABC transporter permease n=1 Tax=Psychroflexus longus TaxID=2873596 RepID=A0ABS7XHP9_9FLAO|nr:ABC transporter permease [Psychroflexus longus]MBZ9778460.1 ABC transporter permease [Psychroflexus longus]
MKTVYIIIRKEFKQIFRNKAMIPIIFVLPLLQLVILSNAATYEVKDIQIGYVDYDHSISSRKLIENIKGSSYFENPIYYESAAQAEEAILKDKIELVIEIPQDFEKNIIQANYPKVAVRVNAIDGASAGVQNVYIQQIISNFNKHIRLESYNPAQQSLNYSSIESVTSFWYNQNLNYKTLMVPGILVLIITMLTLFLSSMNIVREKEIGTLEQINVTPIKKWQFIVGKLFPFWVIGLMLLSIGLLIAKLIFNTPMLGSNMLIYAYTSLYLLLILGMGLLISNFTDTQQQAMFIAWFFVVIFILMSGLFTPIESMPIWAQNFTQLNPVAYFVEMMRMIMLKGSTFQDTGVIFMKTFIYALVMNFLAVWSYQKKN